MVEPFLGSAALFLNTSFKKYLLCDTNLDLINLYNNLKNNPENLLSETKKLFTKYNNTEEQFYILRNKFNLLKQKDLEKSALFIYLNKHAFNGLCRYNAKGIFNVPYGRYKSPEFPKEKMYNFAHKSQNAVFKWQDFNITFAEARKGDIFYCDPPYVPLSATSSFTSYASNKFRLKDQELLANNAYELKSKGIQCIISNHDLEYTRQLYNKAKIFNLKVQRNIASKLTSRKRVGEIIAVF